MHWVAEVNKAPGWPDFDRACLCLQVGCSEIVSRIVEDLKDESEPYRRMVMETIDKVVTALGAADIDARLEELLIDGILYAFQEQVRGLGRVEV